MVFSFLFFCLEAGMELTAPGLLGSLLLQVTAMPQGEGKEPGIQYEPKARACKWVGKGGTSLSKPEWLPSGPEGQHLRFQSLVQGFCSDLGWELLLLASQEPVVPS